MFRVMHAARQRAPEMFFEIIILNFDFLKSKLALSTTNS